MAETLSKNQIDQLGTRLRAGTLSEADLRTVDEYRRGFTTAYESVVTTIRLQLHLEPTGRPAKSTSSLIEKLKRESIRLSQVQDIAGCRIVVAGIAEQDHALASLRAAFQRTSVSDRRLRPSHGYRAVHVIAQIGGRPVEVQVRTSLQHLWAELSEKLADMIDRDIKYGGGMSEIRTALASTSDRIAALEALETEIASADALVAQVSHRANAERYDTQLKDLQQKLSVSRAQLVERKLLVDAMLKSVITELDRLGEHPVDLSN